MPTGAPSNPDLTPKLDTLHADLLVVEQKQDASNVSLTQISSKLDTVQAKQDTTNVTLVDGTQKVKIVDINGTAVGPFITVAGYNTILMQTLAIGADSSAVPLGVVVVAGKDSSNNSRTLATNSAGNQSVSLGNKADKVIQCATGLLNSSSTTANQIVVSRTVTAGKTYYLQYFDCLAVLTTWAAVGTGYGSCSLQINGATVYTTFMAGADTSNTFSRELAEPIPVLAGQVVQLVASPRSITPYSWYGNLGGYEK